jgi:hypothetical protein
VNFQRENVVIELECVNVVAEASKEIKKWRQIVTLLLRVDVV